MKSVFSYFGSGFIHVCVFPWFPGQKCGSCFWCDLILLSGSHIVPFSLRRKGPVKHNTNLLVVESCIELNQSIVLYYLWCGRWVLWCTDWNSRTAGVLILQQARHLRSFSPDTSSECFESSAAPRRQGRMNRSLHLPSCRTQPVHMMSQHLTSWLLPSLRSCDIITSSSLNLLRVVIMSLWRSLYSWYWSLKTALYFSLSSTQRISGYFLVGRILNKTDHNLVSLSLSSSLNHYRISDLDIHTPIFTHMM